ncbi:hypothetical protein J3R30DRAFT_1765689 [Lentinula aciculospora]|uniref:Calcium-dependent phosphotriesterase n=1 Tax=Lentinula aciculospora TaxID=153920 RepID=A0A9W9AJT8_9AGAR|nr:hypothetical protein J3R30DRAFT_1765689 [Lentinula aciculospora]
MTLIWSIVFSIFAVVIPVLHFYLAPLISSAGLSYTVQNFGLSAERCTQIEELQACEKIVLHQATGLLYLACSTLSNRAKWLPVVGRYEATADEDYVATYDPNTSKITRLTLENFDLKNNGLAVLGMDVVPSEKNPNELFVYLINDRPRTDGQDPSVVGADTVVEIFKTSAGGDTLVHMKTVRDSAIISPNDVAGFSDGKRFYFTNWYNRKTGFALQARNLLTSFSSIGYCHSDHGCKIAVDNFYTANGIVKAPNGTVYVASTTGLEVKMFEMQDDDSLISLEGVHCDTPIDNLSIDKEGTLFAAGMPKPLDFLEHHKNSSYPSPVCAWTFSKNTDQGAFYGEKYKVQKVYEDDGAIASGATTVVHDAERGRLFMHGVVSHYLTVCHVG